MRLLSFLLLSVILAALPSAHADRGYLSINSPLSDGVAPPAQPVDALSVTAALSFLYANVFGIVSSWHPTTATLPSLPETDAFVRPMAGLIVSVPGLPDAVANSLLPTASSFDVSLSGSQAVQGSFLASCAPQTAVVGSSPQATLTYNSQSGQFEFPAKPVPSLQTAVAIAADPCSADAAAVLSSMIGVTVTSTADYCDVTLPSGARLSTREEPVRRLVSESVLLLSIVSALAPSPSCPAITQFEFANLASIAPSDADAAAALVSATITKASSTLQSRFPSRSAAAVFTAPFVTSAPRNLQVTPTGTVTPTPSVSPSTPVSSTPSPSSTPDSPSINRYQIALWTAVGLILTLAAAVYALVYMDIGRDPVLYSQFKSDNESKRD